MENKDFNREQWKTKALTTEGVSTSTRASLVIGGLGAMAIYTFQKEKLVRSWSDALLYPGACSRSALAVPVRHALH